MPEQDTTIQPPEQNPHKGGSYLRQADGSLERRESTSPAESTLATDPAKPAKPPLNTAPPLTATAEE